MTNFIFTIENFDRDDYTNNHLETTEFFFNDIKQYSCECFDLDDAIQSYTVYLSVRNAECVDDYKHIFTTYADELSYYNAAILADAYLIELNSDIIAALGNSRYIVSTYDDTVYISVYC